MQDPYSPRDYWEQRLSGSFNLRGVGHRNFSESYNDWLYRRKARCLTKALEGATVQGAQVLDIGCGTGFFVDQYLRRGATVRGIDITDVSIRQLREKYRGQFDTQDISAAEFVPAPPVDIVNMWDVMYHIVDPESYERALANIARSLKPGGLFLFTDWFGAPADHRIAAHVQGRCLATHQQRLGALGFTLEGLHPLYHMLNTRRLGLLDDFVAPVYYLLDNRATKVSKENLSLGVWRKGAV